MTLADKLFANMEILIDKWCTLGYTVLRDAVTGKIKKVTENVSGYPLIVDFDTLQDEIVFSQPLPRTLRYLELELLYETAQYNEEVRLKWEKIRELTEL